MVAESEDRQKAEVHMKRDEIVVRIDALIEENVEYNELATRIADVTKHHIMVMAMDIVKVILKGRPPKGEDYAKKCKEYFPVCNRELKRLISTLPTEDARKAVTKVYEESLEKFRGYKNYVTFDTDVFDFSRKVITAYLEQYNTATMEVKKL